MGAGTMKNSAEGRFTIPAPSRPPPPGDSIDWCIKGTFMDDGNEFFSMGISLFKIFLLIAYEGALTLDKSSSYLPN